MTDAHRDQRDACEEAIYRSRCARSAWAGVFGVGIGCLFLFVLIAADAATPTVVIAVLAALGLSSFGAVIWISRTRCGESSLREQFEAAPSEIFERCLDALDVVAPSCRHQDADLLTAGGITEMWFWSLGERLQCVITPIDQGCDVEFSAEAIMGSNWGSRQSQRAVIGRLGALVRSPAPPV